MLTLPVPLSLANTRLHWAAKVRAKHEWQARALATEPRLLRDRPAKPLEAVEIVAVFYLVRKRDPDNAAASLKWVLDLLVQLGWLKDDNADVVRGLTVRQSRVSRRSEQRVTLSVESGKRGP